LTPVNKDNLRRLLYPRHIAIIGGTDAALSARQCAAQFDGPVWGVNPKRDNLGGVPCFASVAELPEAPDAVFLATPRASATQTVAELAARGAGGVACYTAGYGELGESGQSAERALVEAAGDMALVGPNCYGLVNYSNGTILWPFGAGESRCDKGIALVMQSGMIPANLTMNARSMPISFVISVGNQAVLAIEDYIDVLVDDDKVTAIGLYIEGIRDIKAFAAAALKALRANKPLVVLKAGSSDLAEALSASHTGSLSGTDLAFQALFKQLGIIRVFSPVEMMETLKFLSVSGAPKGRKIAAFTCSGGEAALLADYCASVGLELPQPTANARQKLVQLLPEIATVSNPLDYTTPIWGNREIMPEVYRTLVADGYDAAITIQDFPPPHIHADNTFYRNDAESFIEACTGLSIPAASCCDLPENIDAETRQMMIDGGITPLQGFDSGLNALANACVYGENRQQILTSQRPAQFELLPAADASLPTRIIDEWQGKRRIAGHGIDVPVGHLVKEDSVDEFVTEFQFPLVVKAISNALPHKSEAGAVRLGIQNIDELKQAISDICNSVSRFKSDIEIKDFLVETMVGEVVAELLVGIKSDRQFGQLLVIASGGVLVELLEDSVTLLLPTSGEQILDALSTLKCFKLLQGFRGKPAANIDTVVSAILALTDFAATHQNSLLEMDVNPLMVTTGRCIAADVMIREIDN
jgi:acyl-CoA synthetase (NDP forming)